MRKKSLWKNYINAIFTLEQITLENYYDWKISVKPHPQKIIIFKYQALKNKTVLQELNQYCSLMAWQLWPNCFSSSFVHIY